MVKNSPRLMHARFVAEQTLTHIDLHASGLERLAGIVLAERTVQTRVAMSRRWCSRACMLEQARVHPSATDHQGVSVSLWWCMVGLAHLRHDSGIDSGRRQLP